MTKETKTKETKVVSLFGGPGTGKSTLSYGIMHEMRRRSISADYIPEYAKAPAMNEDWIRLADQPYIAGKQNHHINRANGHFDWLVCDGALLNSISYHNEKDYGGLPRETFEAFLLELWKRYHNVPFLLERNTDFVYETKGRYQKTLEAAMKVDEKILSDLNRMGIGYITIPAGDDALSQVLKHLGIT